ncbi:hypothetical protein CWM41_28950, partial [Escherichia coli]
MIRRSGGAKNPCKKTKAGHSEGIHRVGGRKFPRNTGEGRRWVWGGLVMAHGRGGGVAGGGGHPVFYTRAIRN